MNLSTVFAGQQVGVTQVGERIRPVTFTHYDLGYSDDETCRLEPIESVRPETVTYPTGINCHLSDWNGPTKDGVPRISELEPDRWVPRLNAPASRLPGILGMNDPFPLSIGPSLLPQMIGTMHLAAGSCPRNHTEDEGRCYPAV